MWRSFLMKFDIDAFAWTSQNLIDLSNKIKNLKNSKGSLTLIDMRFREILVP